MKKYFSITGIINSDLTALVLRIFFGGYMAYSHGYGKLLKWDELKNDFAEPFGMPMWFAAAGTIFAEFYCSLLVTVGLFTRLATLPVIFTMAIAAFKIHAGDPLDDKEGSLTYMAAFIAIYLLGPGKFSIDHLIVSRIKK